MTPAVAITAIKGHKLYMLVCHYFDSEEELLKAKPFVKQWARETFDKRHIRYHSTKAEKYWQSRRPSDPIKSLAIYYKNGKEIKRIFH